MDDGLIEKCKDVESDFSLDEESDSPATSSVSFTEFLEQYKELSDWLLHLKRATVQTVHSQSEKYLNQVSCDQYGKFLSHRSPDLKYHLNLKFLIVSKGPIARFSIFPTLAFDDFRNCKFYKIRCGTCASDSIYLVARNIILICILQLFPTRK